MHILYTVIFLPLVVALVIAVLGEKHTHIRNGLVMGISLYNFIMVISHRNLIMAGEIPSYVLADLDFFKLTLRVDALSLLMGCLITFLWIFTSSYSIGYMSHEKSLTRYFSSLTVCLGATMGIIMAADLMTFFLFYEMLTIAVYPLVVHTQTKEAMRSGTVYLVYLLIGGTMVFFGIILTYFFADGNIFFTPGGIPQLAGLDPKLLYLLFFLFAAGFGVKCAIVPLHVWLPRAMVAPTPVSALLHAVAVVNAGLYGMIRMIYHVFGPEVFGRLHMNTILATMATYTIIVAAIGALREKKIKALLAYSTINQLSYVILGACSLHPMALLGALIHLVYHSVMKITLFYSAGTIMHQTGKTHIKQMKGLVRIMPITCAAFTIGALGISGLPPIAGWVSKWYLIEGFFEIGQPWYAGVFILSTIIEIAFLSPPIIYAYFGGREDDQEKIQVGMFKLEAPINMLLPLVVVAVLSITFGLFGSLPFVFGKACIKILLP